MNRPGDPQTQSQLLDDDSAHVLVRDLRKRHWYWSNNYLYEVLKHEGKETTFAAKIGPSAVSVYHYLCRCADRDSQTCDPGTKAIMRATGLSKPIVVASKSRLEAHGLIGVKSRWLRTGGADTNEYLLLDPDQWNIQGGKKSLPGGNESEDEPDPGKESLPPPVKNPAYPSKDSSPHRTKDEQYLVQQNTKQQQVANATDVVVRDANASNGKTKRVRSEPSTTNQPPTTADPGLLPGPHAELVEQLFELKTGLSKAIIRSAVERNPEEAGRILHEWRDRPQSKVEYCEEKGISRPGALRSMLEHPDKWGEPEASARRREARERSEQKATEERIRRQREAEQLEFQRKMASQTVGRFKALPRKTRPERAYRSEIIERVKLNNPLLVEKAPEGNLEKIKPDSPLWLTYAEALHAAMEDDREAKPHLPGMKQRAAGEEWDEASGGEASGEDDATATFHPELYVEAVAGALQSGTDLSAARQNYAPFLDDSEWEQVCAEVRKRVGGA